MATTFGVITNWVNDLPFWEQAAFDLIVSGKEITDEDIETLMQYLLDENDLTVTKRVHPPLKFNDFHVDKQQIVNYRLRKISNLRNINALVTNQTLEFGANLTTIFGENRSGKSGYARVLGSAGFTRGDREILPDITKPYDPDAQQLVDIELETDGEKILVEHRVGMPCPQLSSFYIFDSTSVIVHLTKKNSISFSPAGLSYLRELVDITDKVRLKLAQSIDERIMPNIYASLFAGDSEVLKIISTISYETDIDSVKVLASLTSADENNYKELKQRVATIETQGISKKIEELEQNKLDLMELISQIQKASDGLGKVSIGQINQEIIDFNSHLEAANLLGLEKFKTRKLRSIGTDEWLDFIESAKLLSAAEVDEHGNMYPQDGDNCLLCQQPLSIEARELITQLWGYLESEVQRQLKVAEQTVVDRIAYLSDLETRFLDDKLAVSRFILDRNVELHHIVKAYQDDCVKTKASIIANIEARQETKLAVPAKDTTISIYELIAQIDQEIEKWQQEEKALETLQQQLLEYEHRIILSKHLNQIETYIHGLKWIDKASRIGGSTRHITTKYNQLFSELVTEEYVSLFEDVLKNLGRPLKVRIDTTSSKGEVYKQLVLEADESTPDKLANPDKILSEGEKRAVALADFLTEIALDISSRGIILDDPVTSLDLVWRKKIAEILVDEAKERQVIVFTHDLPFLYFLREESEMKSVPIDNHWITREPDDVPGHVYLYNSPVSEQDYRNDVRARECYKKAKEAAPEEQLDQVRHGFGILRTSYEVLIMNELFNGVVKRFEERTSFMNLKQIGWDNGLVDKIVEKCELCSGIMEGHSHSDAFAAGFPKPDDLLLEIEEYNNIKKGIKSLRRKVS